MLFYPESDFPIDLLPTSRLCYKASILEGGGSYSLSLLCSLSMIEMREETLEGKKLRVGLFRARRLVNVSLRLKGD